MSENYYELLGVDPSASRDELRDAYRARIDDLTAARERKGVTESQLQGNREEVARVRSAWNVLSDPFQRQRYDTQSASDATGDGDVEIVDDDDTGTGVELTGWRRLMAPPPSKAPQAKGGQGGSGNNTPPRPRKEPTIPLPPGMHIAPGRTRGMALLFDLAVVFVMLFAVNSVLPNLIQDDFADKSKQISYLNDARRAQEDITDAKESVADANKAVADAEDGGTSAALESAQSDLDSAQRDLKDANNDFADAQKDFNDKQKSQGLPAASLPHDVDKIDTLSENLSSDIWGTQVITASVALVLALVYLVPLTARTGQTFGMRRRNIRVVMVDGTPVTTWAVFARFAIPLVMGLAGSVARVPILTALLPIAALGCVLWGYRDANGQGVHDKLARTLVVET